METKQFLTSANIEHQLANIPQITFELTDACNLKCTYCGYGEFYEDYDKRENIYLAFEKGKRLIDYLVKLWQSNQNISANRNVYIGFYGGEPLLNMPFIQSMVAYVEALDCPNRKFTFCITTNAILLHKYMDYMALHNFNILISLDGTAQNNAYRVDKANRSSYERIVKHVDLLKEKHPDYFEKRVNFNAVLHNKNTVEGIYRFFKERYNKTPSIGELNDMGIRESKKAQFIATYRNSTESLYQSEHYTEIEREMFINLGSIQSVSSFIHNHSGFVYKDYSDLLYNKTIDPIPTGTCLPFSKKMFVTVNGKILPCERIGHQYALGQISETGVDLDTQLIANKYNAYYAKLTNQCTQCHNKKGCMQCVFNLENLENQPICKGFMNAEDFRQYTNSQMHYLESNPEMYYRIMDEVIIDY